MEGLNALKTIMVNLILKFSGTFLSLAITIVLIRLVDPGSASKYFFMVSISVVVAAILRGGFDGVVLKNVSRSTIIDDGEGKQIYEVAKNVIQQKSLFVFPIYYITIIFLSYCKNDYSYLILGVVFYVASYYFGLLSIQNNYLLGRRKPQEATCSISVLPPLVLMVGLSLCVMFSIKNIFFISVFYLLSIMFPNFLYSRQSKPCNFLQVSRVELDLKNELNSEAKKLYLPSILSLVNIWVPTVVLGIITSDATVAIFNAANRMSLIFIFVTVSVNSVISPRIAMSYRNNKNKEKALILALKGSFYATFISIIPIVIIYIYSDEIMGVFSADFIQYGYVLKLLLIGQVGNILFGSGGHLLIMTDGEILYKKAMVYSSVISLLAILLLSIFYGLNGCVYATVGGYWVSNIIIILMYFNKGDS